jgi:hypothetical protein
VVVPGIDIRNIEVNETSYGTVSGMLRQVNRESEFGNLHEHREIDIEFVFPVDIKAEPADIKIDAVFVIRYSQSWENLLHNICPSCS